MAPSAPQDIPAVPVAPEFSVHLALGDFKFSCAHFVAYKGYREELHGHNYTMAVKVGGSRAISRKGYVTDFGEMKPVIRQLCKSWTEHLLLPADSDVLTITEKGNNYDIHTEDGEYMSFPKKDCIMLPIVHSTVEEISAHAADLLISANGLHERFLEGGASWLEVSCYERPGQGATYRLPIERVQVKRKVRFSPQPCLGACACASRGDAKGQAPQKATEQQSHEELHSLALEGYKKVISALGHAESSRPELEKTAARAAKAWLELTQGARVPDPLSVVGEGVFDEPGATGLVVVRDMTFHSICEHHLLPFSGKGAIAYLPNGRVLGLSKFARLLHVFARRPQLQERLGKQVADAIQTLVQPRAVCVILEGCHTCMSMRGANTPAVTRTVSFAGPNAEDLSTRDMLVNGVNNRIPSAL